MPMRPPTHRMPWEKTPQQKARDYNKDRGSPSKRGYGYDWQKFRAGYLIEHPLCRDCEQRVRCSSIRVCLPR